ncbi:MAG: ATP-dependent RecD-like DNA helicase [Firmicutes bacterium]|nr:ATP-dependent RecD-like DNA helicase [Bacillota bacterium]
MKNEWHKEDGTARIGYEGIVHDIIYYNEENGYVIAILDAGDDLVSIKGAIPFIREGDRLRVSGKLEVHNFYGEQLNVEWAEHIKPTELDEIYRYLASGIIKGIGETTAHLIIEAFGADALEVLQNTPDKLLAIPGIGPKKLEQILESYKEQYELRDFIMYFQHLNISINMAMRLYKRYGHDAIRTIETNPYVLADEMVGIGFRQADQIAMKMGIDFHSPFRIASGITYLLNKEATNGHTYVTKERVVKLAAQELSVKEEEVMLQLSHMAVSGQVNVEMLPDEHVAVYLPSLFYSEQQVASKITQLMQHATQLKFDDMNYFLDEFQKNRGILLAEKQKEAISLSLESGVFVITGGPGTGKTTIINAIIDAFEKLDKKVLLAAPTGRAAKRMTETTQRESKTIHRLLEFQGGNGPQGENNFQKNADSPLKTDVLIIDEISMVDIVLMYRLLDAVALGTHLILVGDSDQLPSVGPGSVLKDLLESHFVSSIKLTEIYRQSEASLIAVNAHMINRGEAPILNKPDKDFFFIAKQKPEDILNEIRNLVIERLPNYYNLNPMEDIQVLSPVKSGGVGVEALNEMLQAVVNPPNKKKAEKSFGKKRFREGDKVMQIKNNYNLEWTTKYAEEGKGVFNGDIGIITEIDEHERTLTVIYDQEREVIYDFPTVEELVLAYAVTVHKSQGSEFKAVIMPMSQIPSLLTSRNILYTAITRARELLVLVGDKRTLSEMIRRTHEAHRNTGLKQKLMAIKALYGGD